MLTTAIPDNVLQLYHTHTVRSAITATAELVIIINGCYGLVGGKQPQVPCSRDAEEGRLVRVPEQSYHFLARDIH